MNGPPEPTKGPLQRCNAEEGKTEGSQQGLTEFKESELSVCRQDGPNGAKISNGGPVGAGLGHQPGRAPLGAALAAADPLQKGASPLVSSAYGHQISGQKGSESFRLDVYPSGVIMRRTKRLDIKPPVGLKRGNIAEFSCEAARRLREHCVTQEVRGAEVWAFTLTIHRPVDPAEWRLILKRFRKRLQQKGWAGTWRVELQKRKVPHLHCALWLQPGLKGFFAVRRQWLECTQESCDRDARKFAVMGKRIESHGWAIYLALHDGKKKGAQLGWQGKQWGIWGRERFTARQASEGSRELPVGQEIAVRRFLRRLMRSKGSRATIGNAGFLRCMSGEVMTRYLAGLDAGRVAHVSWRENLTPF
jgi:hypothetical protein